MQDVAEQVIRLRRKKPERGSVAHSSCMASLPRVTVASRLPSARSPPGDVISRRRQRRRVGLGGALKPGFGIVKNVDVAGETRAFAVDGDTTGNIAVGAALRRERRNTSD